MNGENEIQPTSGSDPVEENEKVEPSDLEGEGENEAKKAEEGKNEPEAEAEGQNAEHPKQNRKTDAQYAEERRARKAKEEAERKRREDEIRRQAVFDVKKGQVTKDELLELGLNAIDDEDQMFLVESLRKAKAEGEDNPQAYAYRSLYVKQSERKAQDEAKAKADEETKQRRIATVKQDQANFKKKFGKTTADVMKTEAEFMQLFGNLIDQDKGNFTELYSLYSTLNKNQSDVAKAQGSFPTNAMAPSKVDKEETDEEFKARFLKEYGRW